MGVFGLDLWCCPPSVGYLWCSWLGFGFGLLLGRVWFRGRPACPPPFPVPARGVGVCAGPGSRLCPVRLSWVVGVCFFFFCFGFFFSFFFFFLALWSLSLHPLSFGLGWWLSFFFFFFSVPFPRGPLLLAWCCRFWVGGSPVPLRGSPPLFFFFLGGGPGRLWWCWRVVGRLWAVFVPFPLPPSFFFFFGGGACLFLPLPSLGWRTHWPVFSVVFRAGVFSCVLCGHVPAPWVGWALYTVGSAPLLAGLGPGSAGWAAAPGGCLWFWVRGLGLLVSLPLRGAGCNLLGGPSPLSPGALWSRVWPAVPVCGVVARRLPGCAVAGFGLSLRLGSVVSCCAALCRVASRRAVVRCSVARCGVVCRGLAWCRGGSVEVSLACVGRLGLREILLNDHGVLGACTLTLTHGLNLHRASQTGRCTRGVGKAFLLQGRQTDIRSRTVEVASERCLSGEWLSLQLGCAGRVRVGAAGRDELTL